jgi:ribonuclease P protein component
MEKTRPLSQKRTLSPAAVDECRPQTLKKWERIAKRKDFLSVSREAEKKIETREFLVLIKKNSKQHSRLGITVSKKVGNAVRRNRIKRQVREQFRKNKSHLPKGYDIVFIARKGIAGKEREAAYIAIRKVAARRKI